MLLPHHRWQAWMAVTSTANNASFCRTVQRYFLLATGRCWPVAGRLAHHITKESKECDCAAAHAPHSLVAIVLFVFAGWLQQPSAKRHIHKSCLSSLWLVYHHFSAILLFMVISSRLRIYSNVVLVFCSISHSAKVVGCQQLCCCWLLLLLL